MSLLRMFKRYRHTFRKPLKVTIIGAAGRVGRHLALLLRQNNEITQMALYDVVDPNGVREDLAHMDFNAWMKSYTGEECLPEAVACSQLVVLAGGQSISKNADDPEDLFDANAPMVANVMTAIAKTNETMPFIHIITNPLTALVPLAAEVLTSLKLYDPKKLSGCTTIDLVRTRTFIAQLKDKDPMDISVPVIGSRSSESTVPLISKAYPDYDISPKEAVELICRIRHGPLEVLEASKGKASSFMAVSYSASIFCNSVIDALLGKTVNEVAYIPCNIVEQLDYFGTSFTMNANGVKDIDPLPELCAYEKAACATALKEIQKSTQKAKDFSKTLSTGK